MNVFEIIFVVLVCALLWPKKKTHSETPETWRTRMKDPTFWIRRALVLLIVTYIIMPGIYFFMMRSAEKLDVYRINLFEVFTMVLICVFLYVIKKGRAATSSQSRLTYIKNISLLVQVLVVSLWVMNLFWTLAFSFGWHSKIMAAILGFSFDSSVSLPPREHLISMSVDRWLSVVLAIPIYGAVFYLFELYKKSVFFSIKNIRCFYFLGYYIIIEWMVYFIVQHFIVHQFLGGSRPTLVNWGTFMSVYEGIFLLFFAWVMDEARKMREEQDLTV